MSCKNCGQVSSVRLPEPEDYLARPSEAQSERERDKEMWTSPADKRQQLTGSGPGESSLPALSLSGYSSSQLFTCPGLVQCSIGRHFRSQIPLSVVLLLADRRVSAGGAARRATWLLLRLPLSINPRRKERLDEDWVVWVQAKFRSGSAFRTLLPVLNN